jgi:hypothetical protein
MSVLYVIVVLILIGVLLGLVNKYGAEYIDVKYIKLINIVAIICTILWLIGIIFGGFGAISDVKMPRVGH